MSIRSMRLGDTIISKDGEYFEVVEKLSRRRTWIAWIMMTDFGRKRLITMSGEVLMVKKEVLIDDS